ncbi:sterol desaturase family protein [Flavobacterium sp. MDT1-60]|uniref:sterol desaturase family protein n=1 Tax=Flavobacterium sp. MDT1-60 TaxID=1979344 RepID=UPI001786F42F|nr:sterol desaturase family protein [Flavobacterium sp. MDT1-60]QOG04464.1 sterol desaturase family protein [Flavobacterium sp. MDT1-60]
MAAIPNSKLTRDLSISLLLYALPVLAIYLYFKLSNGVVSESHITLPSFLEFTKPAFENIRSWGLIVFMLVLGIIEFTAGLYDDEWTGEERKIDIISFLAPKLILPPIIAFFSLTILPNLIPNLENSLSWVPFWGGFFLIAVADDLTQYWYHRLHHQVPFLWRFHRTHHSAPYMGVAMLNRQNFIYTVFFSQIYLTATLTFLGLGLPALFVLVIKSFIVLGAHSSVAWDKPFYKYKVLHPIAWVLERLISTPATHHAHHADTSGDGVGHFKGNFGNMFFLWDIIFGTGLITRKFPKSYGMKSYKQEEWYAQFLWPIFKSKKEGSALADGVLSVPLRPKPENVTPGSVYERAQS